jgi:hypothetical protein
MSKTPTKPRGPNRFRKREVRRLFEAGADRVEYDSKTGRLIGYRHQGETPAPPGSEWEAEIKKLEERTRP